MLLSTLALGAALLAGDTVKANPVAWTVDPAHSEVSFRVRHLTGRVRGHFKEYTTSLMADPAQLTTGSVTVEVKTASVNTEQEKRDAHLRSPDFFDVEKFPAMTFKSTKVDANGKDLALSGDLTIKGVTKPVVLKGTFNGKVTDPWGKERLGFEVSTTIDRRDFGLVWNKLVEGSSLVGDEVTIDIAIEAVKN
jgi:polyisoprenoid-binding protein YceI